MIVVEVDYLDRVKFVRPHAELSGSDLLNAAVKAIKDGNSANTRDAFSRAICAAIEVQQTPGA